MRRTARDEHVDDHQEQIAALLTKTGIGTALEVGDITAATLQEAATRAILTDSSDQGAEVGSR